MVNQATKKGLMILGGLALAAAVSMVNENDYEDQLIMTHHKCVDYPMLAECQNYDASEYRTYMMKKHGDYQE